MKVFLASPGDLPDERKAAKLVVDEFNALLAEEFNYQVQLVGWEDTVSVFGRPQATINRELERCELFVGLMWKRWGTPPDVSGLYSSGFEEEFKRSVERRLSNGRPEISLLFKEIDPEFLRDPGDELKKVLAFKSQLIAEKTILFESFSDIRGFETKFRRCITTYIRNLRAQEQPVALEPPGQGEEFIAKAARAVSQDTFNSWCAGESFLDPGSGNVALTAGTSTMDELAFTKTLLREAASQRILMQGWLDDLEFIKGGGRVWYAVDTDIVTLFTAPTNMSLREGNRIGYAAMFSAQVREQSVALGYALAEHIFFSLGRWNGNDAPPLLIMPGHDTELERVVNGIAEHAVREQGQEHAIADWLAATQKKIDATPNDELLAEFERQFPRYLARFQRRDTPAMELARYKNRLWQHCRLMPVDLLPTVSDGSPGHQVFGELATALAKPASEREQIALRDLRLQWYDRLLRTKPGRKDWHVLTDAHALARLEWISGRLRDGGDKHRLVLITGDRSIEAALAHLDTGDETRSAVHIRHPRAYVGAPEIIFPARKKALIDGHINEYGQDKPDFVGWLDTLLAEPEITADHVMVRSCEVVEDAAKLNALASEIMQTRPRVVTEFKTRLSKYLAGVIKTQADTLGSGGLETTLFDMLSSRGVTREDLLDYVRDELNRRWNELFFVSVLIGGSNVLSPAADQESLPSRIPPPVVFDDFEGAQQFFEYLITRGVHKADLDGIKRQNEFSTRLKAVQERDAENYHLFVAHAAIFAYAGNWRLAETTAEMACAAAPKAHEIKSDITGREAWLLLATARRHNARTEGDLDASDAALTRAVAIFENDDRKNKQFCALPQRVEAEKIAILITRELFRKFEPDLAKNETQVSPPQDDAHYVELAGRVEAALKDTQEVVLNERDNYRHKAWRVIDSHLLSNWFTVQFSLLRGSRLSRPEVAERAAGYRDRLVTYVNEQPSFLPKVLLAIINIFLASEPGEKRGLINLAQAELAQATNHRVWRYDAEHYADLRSLLTKASRSSPVPK